MQYVSILVGGCNVIMKMPLKKNLSKQWDHVGGMLVSLQRRKVARSAHCGKKIRTLSSLHDAGIKKILLHGNYKKN
jgi:hypothetical protein